MTAEAFEEVQIEVIHVGDSVVTEDPSFGVRRVIAMDARINHRTERVVGWTLVLVDGSVMWWRRGQTVWRRRIT